VIRAVHFRNLIALSALTFFVAFSFPSTAQEPTAQEPTVVHNDPYKKWLDEDVRWIITDQERADFRNLSTDDQQDKFVVAFWNRRNPVPGAAENTFKEEHYRRIAYSNQHFAEGIPGWKTDRGRFYITYGPPDKVVRHPSSTKPQPDGVDKTDFGSEEWRWEYIEGIGRDVTLKFVDTCGCGEYHLPVGKMSLK
jgi:GWxTD domain-containing protein